MGRKSWIIVRKKNLKTSALKLKSDVKSIFGSLENYHSVIESGISWLGHTKKTGFK